MLTLHSYILRELLKTFGLALTALTVLFTMGGGLYNMAHFEGVSAGDVLEFLPLLIPVVITVTMPMAALFAATMVYGRLAADNELLACRAAGINIHSLVKPVLLLAVFVAAFTILFWNFVIPGFMARIDDFARSNLRDIVSQQLEYKGFVNRGRKGEDQFTFTAEKVQGVSDAALQAKDFEVARGLQYLLVTNPTVLHVDRNGDLVQFAVAKHVLCAFDARVRPVQLTLHVRDGQNFELGKRAFRIEQQQFGPIALAFPVQVRLTSTDLGSLLRWRQAPWESPRLGEDLQKLGADVTKSLFYDYCAKRLDAGEALELADEYGQQYSITAKEIEALRDRLTLKDARIELHAADHALRTVYEAARVDVVTVALTGRTLASLRLVQTPNQDVLEYDVRAGRTTTPRRKETLNLDQLLVPNSVLADVQEYSPQRLLDANSSLPIDAAFGERRISLQTAAGEMCRKIVSTINFRMGFSCSALVTLLMGACLGIMFRGARALAAFALALIPFFSVLILMLAGRQMTESAPTTAFGPLVTWGGLGLAFLVDLVILRLGVRR
jgi:lipopolysaccharide export LptBFGC system permease protein LptF